MIKYTATISKSIKGFTLVELSIVIVIIGLIVAGITAGQNLVKSAKLRGLLTEAKTYAQAITTFKLQYDALPGDMRNASSYWPGVGNGNGNKKILPYAGGNYVSPAENHLAIKHLTLASMAPYNVTGLGAAPTNAGALGVDVPISSNFNKVVFYLESDEFLWPATNLRLAQTYRLIPSHNKLFLIAGRYVGTALNGAGQMPETFPFLSLLDTIALDTKIDDGYRLKGTFKAAAAFSSTEALAANPFIGQPCSPNDATSEYYTNNLSTRGCVLFFDMGI